MSCVFNQWHPIEKLYFELNLNYRSVQGSHCVFSLMADIMFFQHGTKEPYKRGDSDIIFASLGHQVNNVAHLRSIILKHYVIPCLY